MLILFEVNNLHNIVHILVGALLLVGARRGPAASQQVNNRGRGVLAEHLVIEVVDAVAGLVVALVVLLTGDTAVDRGLLGGAPPSSGDGREPGERDRRLRESVFGLQSPSHLNSCSDGRMTVQTAERALVEDVRARLPAPRTVQDAADVFALLSDPSRLRLLASLHAAGELCVSDLAAASGMTESAASHALRLLRAHGVVIARREGRMVHYSLRDGHVGMLLDVTLEHVSHAGG